MRMVAPLEVGICCSNLDMLGRFYTEFLGCKTISEIQVPAAKAREACLSDGAYSVLRLETPWGERIKLLQPQKLPTTVERTAGILDRRNTSYLTFIVDDLAAVTKQLVDANVEVLTGPQPVAVRPGVWLCFALDPEKNVLEFVQYERLESYRDLSNSG